MKKDIKKYLFGFIIGVILTSGIAVFASELFASSISFTPSNPNWELEDNNVEEAINYLFEYGNKAPIDYSFTDLGLSKNSTTTVTFSPGDYKYLYLLNIYWLTKETGYSSVSNRLKISSITNAEYKSIGIVGKDGVSSVSASRLYILKVLDNSQNVSITFNNNVDSISVYGIN